MHFFFAYTKRKKDRFGFRLTVLSEILLTKKNLKLHSEARRERERERERD